MNGHALFKRLIQNQEIFESGSCKTFKDIPCLKGVLIFTKNKKSFSEEDLLLKVSFLQLFFDKKVFLLVGFKNNQVFKKVPIGGAITLRRNLSFFLDFFFHTFVKKKEDIFLIKSKFYVFKFLFKEKNPLLKHFFKYSLYLFRYNF